MGYRVCAQLMHSARVGWWCANRVMFLDSHLAVSWLQPGGGGGLCADGQDTVNFFRLVGVSVAATPLKDVAQNIICSP